MKTKGNNKIKINRKLTFFQKKWQTKEKSGRTAKSKRKELESIKRKCESY